MVEATCVFTKKRLMEEEEYARKLRLKLQAESFGNIKKNICYGFTTEWIFCGFYCFC